MDPKAGNELFSPAAGAFIMSGALEANADSRATHASNYRTSIKDRFAHRTLAQMSTQQAADDEVTELLNVTKAHKSIGTRRQARMIITGTMDTAAKAEKIGRHKLAGIAGHRGVWGIGRNGRRAVGDGGASGDAGGGVLGRCCRLG